MLIKKANVFFMPFNKCVQTGINSGTNNRKETDGTNNCALEC